MQVLSTIAAVRAARPALGTLGFVPTMGFLHRGHLALVAAAQRDNDAVAVSIFVNPTQFGPHEDLARYPRDLPRDLALLQAAGVALVFTPSVDEIYPPGSSTFVEVGAVSEPSEGARRPGHFRGVATVVATLFNIMAAERAYFGQKDAQQVAVLQQMVRDLAMPTALVVVPTMREADGLAMSSRNVYLDQAQRRAAPALYRALVAAQSAWQGGERHGDTLRAAMLAVLANEPLAQVDYVSVADPVTLAEIGDGGDRALASLAVRFGGTRLIDNAMLE